MSSDRVPVKQKGLTLHLFHSRAHRCCLRLHGMCSCPVSDPYRTLGGDLGSPAIRYRAPPVCIETELFAEPQSSTRCNRFRGCGREAEVSSHAGWHNSRHSLRRARPPRWAATHSFATRGDRRFEPHCCLRTIDDHRGNGWLAAAMESFLAGPRNKRQGTRL